MTTSPRVTIRPVGVPDSEASDPETPAGCACSAWPVSPFSVDDAAGASSDTSSLGVEVSGTAPEADAEAVLPALAEALAPALAPEVTVALALAFLVDDGVLVAVGFRVALGLALGLADVFVALGFGVGVTVELGGLAPGTTLPSLSN